MFWMRWYFTRAGPAILTLARAIPLPLCLDKRGKERFSTGRPCGLCHFGIPAADWLQREDTIPGVIFAAYSWRRVCESSNEQGSQENPLASLVRDCLSWLVESGLQVSWSLHCCHCRSGNYVYIHGDRMHPAAAVGDNSNGYGLVDCGRGSSQCQHGGAAD